MMNNASLQALCEKYPGSKLDELKDIYPVEVGKICAYLGITASYVPLSDDISGRIYVQDNQYFIEVNLRHVNARRRFTVAHELGHYCLHKDFLDSQGMILERSVGSITIRDKEIEADDFAAELLMPKSCFINEYEKRQDMSSLVQYFFVSEAAIRTRVKKLSL